MNIYGKANDPNQNYPKLKFQGSNPFTFSFVDQRFFQPVFAVGEQLQSDVVKTSKASTVMECLLRCSRMTECKSASTEETSIGRSPAGYCQLYRRPFDETSRPASYFKLKQYYNELN